MWGIPIGDSTPFVNHFTKIIYFTHFKKIREKGIKKISKKINSFINKRRKSSFISSIFPKVYKSLQFRISFFSLIFAPTLTRDVPLLVGC